jgi:hypothetical protein
MWRWLQLLKHSHHWRDDDCTLTMAGFPREWPWTDLAPTSSMAHIIATPAILNILYVVDSRLRSLTVVLAEIRTHCWSASMFEYPCCLPL